MIPLVDPVKVERDGNGVRWGPLFGKSIVDRERGRLYLFVINLLLLLLL